MTVIIGTGNASLDAHIKKHITSSAKVNYLEELNDYIGKVADTELVILSSFLPSVHDDTEQQKAEAFISTIQLTLAQGIRVVFLTDTTFPIQDLNILFKLGIYDFIISEDGDVNIPDIMNKVQHATNKMDAQLLIEKFAKKQSPSAQRGRLLLSEDNELYQHIEYKDGQNSQPFDSEPEADVLVPKFSQKEDVLARLAPINPTSPFKPNRQKTLETKDLGQIEEAKTFAFWGASTNLGKRTLSQSFAIQIAKMGYSVLYVELDYLNPTLALTTALTNPDKNFYQLSLSQDSFDLDQFIANKMDVKITKDMLPLFNEIPSEFNFLGLPAGFDSDLFPSITNEGFLSTLISALKEVNYDAVVINLPNQVENLFSFPVMLESDVVFAVTTANPIRVNDYRNMKKMLEDTPLNMDKWEVIVNQVGSEISKDDCNQLLREEALLTVSYDTQRPTHELDLRFGSPSINQKMNELAGLYGFLPPEPTVVKKKGFFRR
ncbi:CpaE family protein [Viridibacillus arvi]|uniref:CpaE family protein n=1 Tax=Viridibacillus arvi TaxID=263475 RepID=UPI0034CE9C22